MIDPKIFEQVKKILDEPVTCEDGKSHYIDENNKRYLSSFICQLFETTYPTDEQITRETGYALAYLLLSS